MPEIWDLYDRNKLKTGEVIERERVHEIPKERYHLAVDIWVKTSDGRYLITQRSEKKPSYPLYWECTGGAVVSGEESIDGAVRELAEETGIHAEKSDLRLVNTVVYSKYIMDVYLYERDVDMSELVLQDDEVCDAKLATVSEILAMIENDEFIEHVWKRFAKVK